VATAIAAFAANDIEKQSSVIRQPKDGLRVDASQISRETALTNLAYAVSDALPPGWNVFNVRIHRLDFYRKSRGMEVSADKKGGRLKNRLYIYFVPDENDPETTEGAKIVPFPVVARTSGFLVYMLGVPKEEGWPSSLRAIVGSISKVDPSVEWTGMTDEELKGYFEWWLSGNGNAKDLNARWREQVARLRPFRAQVNAEPSRHQQRQAGYTNDTTKGSLHIHFQ